MKSNNEYKVIGNYAAYHYSSGFNWLASFI